MRVLKRAHAKAHTEAAQHAAELNAALHGRSNSPENVLCFACAALWPLMPESHADDVVNWLKPYPGHPGVLPRPRKVGPYERWDVEELRAVMRGDFADGFEDILW